MRSFSKFTSGPEKFQKLFWAHRLSKPTILFLEMPIPMGDFLCLLLRLDVKICCLPVNKEKGTKTCHLGQSITEFLNLHFKIQVTFNISGVDPLPPVLLGSLITTADLVKWLESFSFYSLASYKTVRSSIEALMSTKYSYSCCVSVSVSECDICFDLIFKVSSRYLNMAFVYTRVHFSRGSDTYIYNY